jgi:hypothetical protein
VPIDVLVQGPTANVAAQIVIHAAGENQATATFEPSGDHRTDAQVRSALVQIARREGQTSLTVNGESVVASPAQSTVSKRGAGQEPPRAVSVEPSQAGDRTIDVSLLTAAERRFLRGRQSRGLSGIDVDNIARKLGVSVSELFSPAVRAAIGTFDAQREERRGAMVEQLGDVDEFIARVEETPRLRAGDRLPPETDEQILRGLAEGKSLREIASELGISDTTVGTRLDVLGNAYQPSDRQLLSTEGRDADILRARARGQTLEQIAFDSVSTVSDVRRVVRGAMAEDHPLIVNPDGTERPPTQTVEQYIAARQALAREAEQIAEQMAAANPDIVVYVWLQAGRGKVAEEVGKTLGVSKFDTRRLLREAIELYGKPEALVDDGTRTAVRSAMDAIRSAVMHRSPPQRIPLLRSAINELSASGVAPDLAESLQRMFDQDPAELAQVVRLARLNEPGSAVNDKFKMDESGWRELADRLLEKLSEEQVSDLLSPLRRANAGSTGTEPDTTGWSSNTDSQTRVDRFDTRLLNRWFAEPINGTNGQQQYNNFLDFAQQRGLADELAEVGHAPTLDPSGSDGQPNPDANVNRALLTAVLDLRRDRSKAAKDLFKSLPVQVQEFADIVINANAPQANGEASPRKSYLARSFRPQQVDPGTLADALPSSGQLLVETGIAALDEYKPDARGTHFPTEMLLQLKFSQKTEEVNRAADYFARLLQRALGPAEQANARGVELVPVPSSTPGSLTSTLRVLTRLNMLQKQAGKPAYKIRPLIVNPFGRPSVRSGPGNAATKQQDHQLLRGATNPDKVYVLIDDVVTTGGTITAAMQAMLQNSADKSRPIKVAPLGLTMTRRLSGPQAERLIDGARRGPSNLGEVVKSVVKPADVERMARDPDYFAGQDEKIVRRFAAVRDLREYMGNYGLLEVDVDVPTLQTDLSTGRSAPGDDLIQPQSSSRAGTGNSNVDAAAQNPKELAEQLANGTLPLEEIEHALRKTFSYLDDQQATQIARAAHDDHITAAGNAADAYTTIDRLLKSGSQDASAYERAVDDITGAAISSGTRLASAIGEVLVKLALDERLPKNWRQRAADQAAKAGYDVKVPQDARDTFSYGALSPDFEQRYQLELKKNPTTPNRTAVELLKATGAQGNPKLLVLEPKGIAENLLNHPVASRLRGAVPTVGPDEVGGSHALHVLSQASATPVELSLHTAGDMDPVIGPASQAGVVNASFSWLGSQNQVALETAVSSTPNVVWVLPVHNLNDGDAAKTELVIRFEKFMRRLDENGKLANATPSQLREARQQALKAINATEAELTAAVKVYEERVEYLRNTTALLKYPNVMIVSGADAAGNPSTVGEVDGVFTDVAGPGEDVVAAADPASGKLWASGFDGLSLSSPYVAQYLAVAKAFGGRLPPKELIRLARDTADKSDAFIGLNVAGGTLNPDAFLRAAAVAETVLKTTGVTIDRAAEQLGVQLTEAERRSVQGAVDRTRDPSLEPRIEFGRQQTEEPASISFTPLKYASSSGSSGSAMAPQTMGGPGRSESGGDADAGWLPVSVPGVDGEAQYKILWESPAIDPRSRNAFVPVDIRFRSDQGREMTARLLASLDTERPRAGKVEALTWSGDSRDDAAFFRVITKVAEHQRGITQDSLTMTAPNGTTFIARREDQSWVNASPTMPGPQSSDAAAQLAAAIRDLRRYLQSKTPTPSQSLPGEGVTERPTPPSRPIPPPNFLARRTYSIAASSAVGSDLSPGQARRVGRRQLVTTSVLDNGLLRTTYGPDLISGKALKSLAGLVSAREAFLQEALKGRYVVVANRQSGQDTSPVAAISMELDPSGNGPAVVRVVHGSGQVIEDLLKSAVRAADEGGVRIVEVRGPTSTDNDGLLTSMDLTEEEQRAQYGLSNVQHSQLSFVPYDGNTVAEQMLNEAHLAGKAVSESVESILETVAQGRSRSNAARQRAHESATDFLHQLLAVKTQAVGVGAGQSMQWMLDAVESMVSALHPDNGDGRWRYGRQSGVNNARTLYHVQGFIDSLMHDLGTMVGQDGALERFNANRNPAVENASVAPRNLEFAVENTTDRTVRQQFEPLFRDIVSGKYDQYIPVHRRAGQELRTGMDPKSPYTTYDGKQPAQLVWADPRRREIIFDDLFFRAGIPLNDASPINRELGRLARRELFGADNENVENPLARRIYEIVVKTGRSSIAADTMRPSIGTELESYFQDTGVLTLSNGQRYDANPKRGQRDRGILHRDQPEAIYESGYGMLVHVLQLANVTRREISKWFGGVGSSSTVASPKGLTTERLANFLLEISSLWLPNKVNKGPVFALVQALAELSERNQADRREARRARELLQEAEDDPDTFNRVYFWRELGRRPESEVEAALKDAGAALSEKVAVTVRVVNDILREISKKVKPLYDIKYAALDNVPTLTFYRNAYVKNMTPDRMTALDPTIKAAEQARITIRTLVPAFVAIATAIGSYFAQRNQQSILNRLPPAKDPTKRPAITSTPAPTDQRIADLQSERSKLPSKLEDARSRATAGATELDILSGDYSGIKAVQDFNARTKASVENLDRQIAAVKLELQAREADIQRRHGNEGATTPEQNELNRRRDQLEALTTLRGETAAQPAKLINELNEVRRQLVQRRQSELQSKLNELRSDQEDRLQQIDTSIAEARNALSDAQQTIALWTQSQQDARDRVSNLVNIAGAQVSLANAVEQDDKTGVWRLSQDGKDALNQIVLDALKPDNAKIVAGQTRQRVLSAASGLYSVQADPQNPGRKTLVIADELGSGPTARQKEQAQATFLDLQRRDRELQSQKTALTAAFRAEREALVRQYAIPEVKPEPAPQPNPQQKSRKTSSAASGNQDVASVAPEQPAAPPEWSQAGSSASESGGEPAASLKGLSPGDAAAVSKNIDLLKELAAKTKDAGPVTDAELAELIDIFSTAEEEAIANGTLTTDRFISDSNPTGVVNMAMSGSGSGQSPLDAGGADSSGSDEGAKLQEIEEAGATLRAALNTHLSSPQDDASNDAAKAAVRTLLQHIEDLGQMTHRRTRSYTIDISLDYAKLDLNRLLGYLDELETSSSKLRVYEARVAEIVTKISSAFDRNDRQMLPLSDYKNTIEDLKRGGASVEDMSRNQDTRRQADRVFELAQRITRQGGTIYQPGYDGQSIEYFEELTDDDPRNRGGDPRLVWFDPQKNKVVFRWDLLATAAATDYQHGGASTLGQAAARGVPYAVSDDLKEIADNLYGALTTNGKSGKPSEQLEVRVPSFKPSDVDPKSQRAIDANTLEDWTPSRGESWADDLTEPEVNRVRWYSTMLTLLQLSGFSNEAIRDWLSDGPKPKGYSGTDIIEAMERGIGSPLVYDPRKSTSPLVLRYGALDRMPKAALERIAKDLDLPDRRRVLARELLEKDRPRWPRGVVSAAGFGLYVTGFFSNAAAYQNNLSWAVPGGTIQGLVRGKEELNGINAKVTLLDGEIRKLKAGLLTGKEVGADVSELTRKTRAIVAGYNNLDAYLKMQTTRLNTMRDGLENSLPGGSYPRDDVWNNGVNSVLDAPFGQKWVRNLIGWGPASQKTLDEIDKIDAQIREIEARRIAYNQQLETYVNELTARVNELRPLPRSARQADADVKRLDALIIASEARQNGAKQALVAAQGSSSPDKNQLIVIAHDSYAKAAEDLRNLYQQRALQFGRIAQELQRTGRQVPREQIDSYLELSRASNNKAGEVSQQLQQLTAEAYGFLNAGGTAAWELYKNQARAQLAPGPNRSGLEFSVGPLQLFLSTSAPAAADRNFERALDEAYGVLKTTNKGQVLRGAAQEGAPMPEISSKDDVRKLVLDSLRSRYPQYAKLSDKQLNDIAAEMYLYGGFTREERSPAIDGTFQTPQVRNPPPTQQQRLAKLDERFGKMPLARTLGELGDVSTWTLREAKTDIYGKLDRNGAVGGKVMTPEETQKAVVMPSELIADAMTRSPEVLAAVVDQKTAAEYRLVARPELDGTASVSSIARRILSSQSDGESGLTVTLFDPKRKAFAELANALGLLAQANGSAAPAKVTATLLTAYNEARLALQDIEYWSVVKSLAMDYTNEKVREIEDSNTGHKDRFQSSVTDLSLPDTNRELALARRRYTEAITTLGVLTGRNQDFWEANFPAINQDDIFAKRKEQLPLERMGLAGKSVEQLQEQALKSAGLSALKAEVKVALNELKVAEAKEKRTVQLRINPFALPLSLLNVLGLAGRERKTIQGQADIVEARKRMEVLEVKLDEQIRTTKNEVRELYLALNPESGLSFAKLQREGQKYFDRMWPSWRTFVSQVQSGVAFNANDIRELGVPAYWALLNTTYQPARQHLQAENTAIRLAELTGMFDTPQGIANYVNAMQKGFGTKQHPLDTGIAVSPMTRLHFRGLEPSYPERPQRRSNTSVAPVQPKPTPPESLPLPKMERPRPPNQSSAPSSGDPPNTVLSDGLGAALEKGVEPLLPEVNGSVADTPGAWQPQSRLSRLVNKLDGGGGAAQKKR